MLRDDLAAAAEAATTAAMSKRQLIFGLIHAQSVALLLISTAPGVVTFVN